MKPVKTVHSLASLSLLLDDFAKVKAVTPTTETGGKPKPTEADTAEWLRIFGDGK